MTATLLLILRLLLVVAVYAFLTWALLLLWRDLQRQAELVVARQTPQMILQPLDGGPPRHLATPVALIGRDPICDCPLDDPTVSTRHARLSYHHGQWWLEDLNSTNGTFLNGEAVSEPVVVTSGDELRCGQVRLRVEIGPASQLHD